MLQNTRKYHAKNRPKRCSEMRKRYHLTAANLFTKDMYILELIKNIQRDVSALEGLVSAFKQEHSDVADNMTAVNLDIAASSIASKRVVNRVLQLRNKYAGALVGTLLEDGERGGERRGWGHW